MTNEEIKNTIITAVNMLDRNLSVTGLKNIEAAYQIAALLTQVIDGISTENPQ